MDETFVDRLVAIFDRSTLTELEYSEQGARLRLVRAAGAAERPATGSTPAFVPESDAAEAAHVAEPSGAAKTTRVNAGLTGTFYRSPSPGQPPFVAVGDLVEEGQTVGVVEAMKMLNPVEAPCSGRVVQISGVDGSLVNADDVLMSLETASGA